MSFQNALNEKLVDLKKKLSALGWFRPVDDHRDYFGRDGVTLRLELITGESVTFTAGRDEVLLQVGEWFEPLYEFQETSFPCYYDVEACFDYIVASIRSTPLVEQLLAIVEARASVADNQIVVLEMPYKDKSGFGIEYRVLPVERFSFESLWEVAWWEEDYKQQRHGKPMYRPYPNAREFVKLFRNASVTRSREEAVAIAAREHTELQSNLAPVKFAIRDLPIDRSFTDFKREAKLRRTEAYV